MPEAGKRQRQPGLGRRLKRLPRYLRLVARPSCQDPNCSCLCTIKLGPTAKSKLPNGPGDGLRNGSWNRYIQHMACLLKWLFWSGSPGLASPSHLISSPRAQSRSYQLNSLFALVFRICFSHFACIFAFLRIWLHLGGPLFAARISHLASGAIRT